MSKLVNYATVFLNKICFLNVKWQRSRAENLFYFHERIFVTVCVRYE